jgi:hypothetical protein
LGKTNGLPSGGIGEAIFVGFEALLRSASAMGVFASFGESFPTISAILPFGDGDGSDNVLIVCCICCRESDD